MTSFGTMEVDGAESWSNTSDGGKFANLKSFVSAAREFEATHSEGAINLMTRYLGLIASSCDLSIFSPGRTEVCAFFSSLWRVMCDGRAPHWAGVAVLSRAAMEPSAKHALTHTYKFMPIFTRLLADAISNEKKIKLLSVMQDISYGIKISWQESYLSSLMKQLTELIVQPMSEPQHKMIGHKSLTVLVNVCYGNLPAIYALMRTVDTKEFVVHLINLKDGGYGGVEVCRLLLCLSGATRGSAATRQADVHSYLCCTMRTFHKAVVERDATQLLHAHTLLKDLCSDVNLKCFVLTYDKFSSGLQEAMNDINELCVSAPAAAGEGETTSTSIRHAINFLTQLISLELYSVRCHHSWLVGLCMKASSSCLPEALELFAAIVSQYRDEGRLPQELISVLSEGLPGLLVPPALEPGKAGLQWLQAVSALCDTKETQDRVLLEVTPESFEDTLDSVLQYTSQNGTVGAELSQEAAAVSLRAALCLAAASRQWRACLDRLLSHHQMCKSLSSGLSSSNPARRRQILQLVKHHCFPSEQMGHVFTDNLNQSESHSVDEMSSISSRHLECEGGWQVVSPAQERRVNMLCATLTEKLHSNQITDIATSSVMELYGYKITCLEQRLHSHSVALQGATEQMASLQHTVAMLQATNSSQQDVLYTTQMQNEKLKKSIDDLHKQLEDAETAMKGFRAKIAAERLDKENQRDALHKEFKAQLAAVESEMRVRERELCDQLKQADAEYKALNKKLEQQTTKNNDLASVLIKFEERVKQRDKKLEEASYSEQALRKEMEHKDTQIKQLEKTVVERETRLYQVTTQLDEMKRVQEMVAKLMSKTATSNTSS